MADLLVGWLILLELLGYGPVRYVSISYKFRVDWVKGYGVMAIDFQSSALLMFIG